MPHDSMPAVPHPRPDLAAVAAFFRALAERVERDPDFGRTVAALLTESGLGPGAVQRRAGRRATPSASRHVSASDARQPAGADSKDAQLPDPFALLRDTGEHGLRERLAQLDLPGLRQVVRLNRLDPARISARWTNRERLVDLVVSQVRARADHGKSFAHI
jgi:hypothetical protein